MFYQSSFIQDQDKLIQVLESINFAPITKSSRVVAQFGYEYTYFTDKLTKIGPIPDELNFDNQISEVLGLPDLSFDQLIINKYEKGQGISPHIDNPDIFRPIIACISLESNCELKFSNEKSYGIESRSLYVMTEEYRYLYKHGIQKHNDIRYSLTYRTVI